MNGRLFVDDMMHVLCWATFSQKCGVVICGNCASSCAKTFCLRPKALSCAGETQSIELRW